MAQTADSGITQRDGVFMGPIRRSVNNAINSKGSIHDDETASKLGLRGGTVAGSVHMDLFGPLLYRAFGEDWLKTGCLSLYFLNATVDREPVRAFAKIPRSDANDVQIDVWVEREDGMRVAEGSASIGNPGRLSALMGRPLDRFDPGELRILAGMAVGDAIETTQVTYTADQQAARLKVITEPMDLYLDSEFGGPVVTPSGYVGLLYSRPVETLRSKIKGAVGLFGAIEFRNIDGPLIVGRTYNVGGKIIALGQSPKTEYFWFDSWADDDSGKRIANHRMLLRFMKASSKLYQE